MHGILPDVLAAHSGEKDNDNPRKDDNYVDDLSCQGEHPQWLYISGIVYQSQARRNRDFIFPSWHVVRIIRRSSINNAMQSM